MIEKNIFDTVYFTSSSSVIPQQMLKEMLVWCLRGLLLPVTVPFLLLPVSQWEHFAREWTPLWTTRWARRVHAGPTSQMRASSKHAWVGKQAWLQPMHNSPSLDKGRLLSKTWQICYTPIRRRSTKITNQHLFIFALAEPPFRLAQECHHWWQEVGSLPEPQPQAPMAAFRRRADSGAERWTSS